jgi:hypothetical protein
VDRIDWQRKSEQKIQKDSATLAEDFLDFSPEAPSSVLKYNAAADISVQAVRMLPSLHKHP